MPLLERSKYQTFRIHPLPTVQEVLGNGTGRDCVKSEYDCLVIKGEQWIYLLLKEQDWKSCKTTAAYHGCLKGAPIDDFKKRSRCEALLQTKAIIEALRL